MEESDKEAIRRASPPAAVALLSLCLILGSAVPALLGWTGEASVVFALLIFAGAMGLSVGTFLLVKKGEPTRLGAVDGVVFALMVGGPAWDIFATLTHSPDLAQEANPVARMLLDSGSSVMEIYVYAGVLQSMIVFNMCAVWLAFRRHRRRFLESCGELGGASFARFLKAAFGGGRQTWRQWLLPLKYSDLRLFSWYHVVWILTPFVLVSAVGRWYLGFEWFGWVPNLDRETMGAIEMIVPLVGWGIWLYVQFVSLRTCRVGPAESPPENVSG